MKYPLYEGQEVIFNNAISKSDRYSVILRESKHTGYLETLTAYDNTWKMLKVLPFNEVTFYAPSYEITPWELKDGETQITYTNTWMDNIKETIKRLWRGIVG